MSEFPFAGQATTLRDGAPQQQALLCIPINLTIITVCVIISVHSINSSSSTCNILIAVHVLYMTDLMSISFI